jgi:predicted AlkP superfamily phosphohydrolase/phosphomutase
MSTYAPAIEYARIGSALWLVAAVALLGCSSAEEPEPEAIRHRVLVIGIDGASFRIAEPMMKQGMLPNLASLANEGVSGPLASVKPLLSPRIWNSIATGKHARKHGITGFARKDDEGNPHLLLSHDRKAHALWNIVSDAGHSVVVVNWWNTYPPERIDGVMVSDHLMAKEVEGREEMSGASLDSYGPVIYPEEWVDRLSNTVAKGPPVDFVDPFAGNPPLPRWIKPPNRLSRHFREDGALARIALEVEAAEDPDVMMVLLFGIDRISHWLWGNMEPADLYPEGLQPSDIERKAGRGALEAYYRYTDELIGALLDRYDSNDLAIVISDHGFEAGTEMGFLTGIHDGPKALHGVFLARGAGIPAGQKVAGLSIYDVTPTVLAWLGLPPARDMDGRPGQFLKDVLPPIKTYDTTAVERIGTAPSGADDVLIQQLRELGYIK